MNYVTKEEASNRGEIFYFTGKPCKHGHISERLVKGGACRTCKNLSGQKHREENRDEYNAYCRTKKKESYSTEKRRNLYKKNIVSELFYAAKTRAKIKDIPFTITMEDVIIPDKCPIFGIKFDYSNKAHTPSLDRIVNDKGYIKGNVQVISLKANRLKSNATLDEIKLLMEYMSKNG